MAGNGTQPPRQVYRSTSGRTASRAPARPAAPHRAPTPAGADPRIPSQRATAQGGGWYQVPPQPAPTGQRRARSVAHQLREKRRRQKRLRFFGVVGGILLLSGIITLLLPAELTRPAGDAAADTGADPGTVDRQLVAPLPYGGQQAEILSPAVNWGTVGPQRQDGEGITLTAAPAEQDALPAFGNVTTQWFADAAFLGDSLTVGYIDYDISVADALICAYTGASPNQIVNRAALTHPERGDEIPLDVLAAAQPKKLYVLMGTNALRFGDNNDGFLAYYGRMLDELRAALPNTMIFVQSVLPVRPEALADSPGLAPETLREVNAAIAAQCKEKGCYFLDLNAEFSDAAGALQADYAQPDGIHLTTAGYRKWVAFLTAHTPYDRHNPYQPGSEWYLSANLLDLLSDLP